MSYESKLKKLDALIANLKAIKSSVVKSEKLTSRECKTVKQSQNKMAAISYESMHRTKSIDEAHALCVELGLADKREDSYYVRDPKGFYVDQLHFYPRNKREPSDFLYLL